LIKIIIKEEIFKWHLEAFASELFIYITKICSLWKKNAARIITFTTYLKFKGFVLRLLLLLSFCVSELLNN